MLRVLSLCTLCILISGCAVFGFKADRKSRFVDIDANAIYVEYGMENRTETLPNGAELKFDRKVRVTLPDGKRLILYQTLASSGVRYQTADKKFTFVEKGPYCQILENEITVYQGFFNRNCTKKK